eukprot:1151426-Pelagomonas_calceolata.AAC.13
MTKKRCVRQLRSLRKGWAVRGDDLQPSDMFAFMNQNNHLLRAHTLNEETASWEDWTYPVCDRCSCGQIQDEAHVRFAVSYFLLQLNKKHFMSELLDLLLAGMDQPQADQPNSLAEDLPV